MRLRYSAAARVDLQEAREWYREHSSSLEERFAEAVAHTIETILTASAIRTLGSAE